LSQRIRNPPSTSLTQKGNIKLRIWNNNFAPQSQFIFSILCVAREKSEYLDWTYIIFQRHWSWTVFKALTALQIHVNPILIHQRALLSLQC
jgi:hypothetical protein